MASMTAFQADGESSTLSERTNFMSDTEKDILIKTLQRELSDKDSEIEALREELASVEALLYDARQCLEDR